VTPTVVVTGPSARAREAAIAARFAPGDAAILEGLPDGKLDAPLDGQDRLHRIAPGCLCCTGNLVLRITLNRLLRHPPSQLFIALADPSHLATLHAMLAGPPYDGHLALKESIHAADILNKRPA
jgi:G3E family GTPase